MMRTTAGAAAPSACCCLKHLIMRSPRHPKTKGEEGVSTKGGMWSPGAREYVGAMFEIRGCPPRPHASQPLRHLFHPCGKTTDLIIDDCDVRTRGGRFEHRFLDC
jgi:hypothetical protein